MVFCIVPIHLWTGAMKMQRAPFFSPLNPFFQRKYHAKKITMNHPFYQKGLNRFNIEAIVPLQPDQDFILHVIFDELSKGILREESRQGFLKIIYKLVDQGAEGVVLGCTEIPLLVRQQDTDVRIFDTSTIHAEKALQQAIL